MKIHSVYCEGFMLFRDFRKVYGDKDIIGIIAEYKDNPEMSNKGGKSTVVEMILWCLFGISRADFDVELIHRGSQKMFVKIVLVEGERKTIIRRGIDIKNNSILELNGIEKKREAQAEINRIIGMTSEEFLLTNFFKQGDINKFMELKPAQKKEYLMQWLKNNHWPLLERMALDDISEKQKRLDELKAQKELLETQTDSEEELRKKISAKESSISDLDKRIKVLQKKADTKRAQKSVQKAQQKRLAEIEEEIEDIEAQLEEKKEAMSEMDEAVQRLADLKKMVSGFDPTKEAALRSEKAKLDQKVKEYQQKLKAADKDMTGLCPILKEPCDRISADGGQVKGWRLQKCAFETKRDQVAKQVAALDGQREAADEARTQREALADLRGKVAGFDGLEASLKRLAREKKAIGSATAEVSGLAFMLHKIDTLSQELNGATEDLGKLRNRLENAVRLKFALKKTNRGIRNIQQKILPRLRYVAFMFGKNGIPSQEIENAFDEVQEEINFVLKKLGTSLEVQFRPDRETQQWEDLCVECGWQYPKGTRTKTCEECGADRRKKRKDELQLRVLEDGHDEGFHMESGGGKTLVSIATRIAMTRLLQKQTGSNFNVIFLDEPDSAFDPVNRSKFVNLITTTLVKHFGFEQVFWITHAKEFQDQVPHVLQVKRNNEYSEARWL